MSQCLKSILEKSFLYVPNSPSMFTTAPRVGLKWFINISGEYFVGHLPSYCLRPGPSVSCLAALGLSPTRALSATSELGSKVKQDRHLICIIFFIYICIILFMYGRSGSLLLCGLFSKVSESGATLYLWCGGFSLWWLLIAEHRLQSVRASVAAAHGF